MIVVRRKSNFSPHNRLNLRAIASMPCPNQKMFETEEFLIQICNDHIFYAEKDEVRFDFKKITKVKVFRQKAGGKISKITYRMKGQLGAFQIDGFGDAEMEEIASLLKSRAGEFSIDFVDVGRV